MGAVGLAGATIHGKAKRRPDGVEAWKWNGTVWTQLTGSPGFGDAIVHGEPEYSTLQLADLDGQPGAELINRSAAGALENGGLHVLHYQPGSGGGAWSELVNTGPFATDGLSVCGTRSCWATSSTRGAATSWRSA